MTGTARVLDFARRWARASRAPVVAGIYAAPRDRVGIREDEVDARRPMNAYIRSKLAAEALLSAAAARSDAPEIVVLEAARHRRAGRPEPRPAPAARPRPGRRAADAGRPRLVDLTSVENVALAIRLAATAEGVHGEAFNVTNGYLRPFGEVLEQLLRGLDLPLRGRPVPARVAYALAGVLEGVCSVLPARPEPPMTRYTVTTIAHSQTLDISKARRLLGYEPEVTLDESLAGYARA